MTVRCPSNGCRASSTSGLLGPAAQSSAGRAACSCLPWLAVLLRRPHRPLLLPPLARPSLHSPTPPVILWRRQRSRTSEPSYSSLHWHPLLRLPRLRVVPFLGLALSTAVVLSARRGQCGQRPTSIGRVLYLERLTAGSTDTAQFFCDLQSKSLCQACWAANLSRRGELSFGWPRTWPISNEKWDVHF